MGNTQKTFLIHTETPQLFQDKAVVWLSWTPLSTIERQKNQGYSNMYIWENLTKCNKMSLSLHGEQLTIFIANGKLWASKKILEFWKILSATVVWQLVKGFFDGLAVYNGWFLSYCIVCQHFQDLCISGSRYMMLIKSCLHKIHLKWMVDQWVLM